MPFVPEAALLLRVGGHKRLAPAVFRLLSAFAGHVVKNIGSKRQNCRFGAGQGDADDFLDELQAFSCM